MEFDADVQASFQSWVSNLLDGIQMKTYSWQLFYDKTLLVHK